MHPLEHRLEQAISEIDNIKQILRDHSRKVEDGESTVKRVEGHQEVHENLAQQTFRETRHYERRASGEDRTT